MKRKVKAFGLFFVLIFFISSILLPTKSMVYANNLPSLMSIDSPLNNSMQTNTQISISGWSLNAQGVQKVQIYVDGTYKQDASIGQLRSDVNSAFPGYSGGLSSGYSTNLDISALSVGAHTVTVKSIGNDESVISQNVQIYKVPSGGKNMPQRIAIDTPQNNLNVESLNNNIPVSGWSLNGYGVQKVQVYLDGNYKCDATIGQLRPDVNNAFPGYTGGSTSGYSTNLDISSIPDGVHTITVKSVGNDGQVQSQNVNVNKVSPQSMPAKVNIEAPNNLQTSSSKMSVSGWSLDVYGVQKVQVYVDGTYKQDATIGQSRPDVGSCYPGYTGGSASGYSTNLDISALSVGAHTVTVKSIGNDGSITAQDKQFYKLPSSGKNMPQRIAIDTPQNNSNVAKLNNEITVSGWSLNGYGVQKVQVYLDGNYKCDATIGQSRPDVNNAFPGYIGGSTSGYSTNLDISSILDGVHTITVKSVGNDGQVQSQNVNVNKVSPQSMPAKVNIEAPNNLQTSSSKMSVSGWSLDVYGVQKVQVYVDGTYKQDATIGQSRPDVGNCYPGYTGGSASGYSTNLDISALSVGAHTVTVKSIGNDGSVTAQDKQFYKLPSSGQNMPQRIAIDTPQNNSNVESLNNKIPVSGWSLNGYGVQKVQVYLDGNYKCDATIGQLRPDVNNVFPGYTGGSTSGYSTNLDISSIPDGVHTITVKSVGNDGQVQSKNVNVNKVSPQSMPAKVNIEAPNNLQTNSSQMSVSGWSLDLYGVQKVQVYVDGTYKQDATIGQSRPDVGNAYPGYTGGSASGYSTNLDISALSVGAHTVTVKSIGNDGSVTAQNAYVYKLANGASPMIPKICVEAPSDGTFYKNQPGQIQVSGWSIDAFGIKKVQIYFDNNYSGDATIGQLRTDVNNAYPGYTNGVNSGFSYNLNLSNIPDGVHTITVNSIGNGGGTTTENVKIYKFSFNGQTTLYNLSLQSMVSAQMNYGQPVTESGYSWVGADRNTVQYYVDPMNFMDNYGIYQFLRLDYMQGVTAADLNNILAGKGVLAGKGAQFLAAAQQSNVNPVYLVSHALLETGNGTSTLATGVSVNGQTVYNLFGIGAYDSDPITMGARYAYNQGWTSVDAAIYGGAKWISTDYINNSSYKQNTLYKMRWNPASPANHQYATDVRWAYNQIYNIKKLINMVANPVLQFDVPRYNN